VLALCWHFTPLARLAEPGMIEGALHAFAEGPWSAVIVVATFIVAGLLVFPVMILIAATAATFGPWLGFTYAATGALASALVTYCLGAKLGSESLQFVLGPRLNRLRRMIARQGILAVALIRLVPIAPFSIVNLVAGASGIKL